MKKAVKNIETWNQSLRQTNVKLNKRKKNLEQTLVRMQNNNHMFYERAQRQVFSKSVK